MVVMEAESTYQGNEKAASSGGNANGNRLGHGHQEGQHASGHKAKKWPNGQTDR
jgi:hypothetical protein